MKNVALLILFYISTSIVCAGQEVWQNYNTGNSGLLLNSVSSIVVDHENNLWGAYAGAGGTGSGVVKFNGTHWTHYNSGNSGLPNNDVRVITVDRQGNLWFACYYGGIVRFDGTTWTPYNTSNSGIAGNDASSIAFDYSNKLWVGGYFSGVSKFDGTNWTTYNKSNAPFPDSNCINTVVIGKDNTVWVGLGCSGGLAKFSPLSNTWQSLTPTNSELADHTVNSIFENVDGKIWLAYNNRFVSSFDGTIWTHYTPRKKILGFASDENGELWGYGNGLFKFEGSDWFESMVDGSIDNWGYEFANRGLAITSEGRLWWSIQQKGLWSNPDPKISTFERIPDAFKPVYAGKIKWVDLDSDLDPDILYCGNDEGSPLTAVYENKSGSFAERPTNLPDVMHGSFSTADYDKDGDVDIFISGSNTTSVSRLYRNNGNFSFTFMYPFPALLNSTVSWVDLENDQDLDFLLSGWSESSNEAKVYLYENKGGIFELLAGTNLPACTQCSMDWVDSNGDGYADLLISGFGNLPNYQTSVYLNNKDKTFTIDASSELKSLYNGNVTWGDYDNDHDSDALISGFSEDGKAYSLVYQNNKGVLEERTDINVTPAAENWWGGTAWADFNGDGNLDIVITGRASQTVTSYGFKVHLNDGTGQFYEAIDANFPGINESSVDCADFDGDGDLDISFLGINSAAKPVTVIYENRINEVPKANTPPRFSINNVFNLDEDFQTFKVQSEPAGVPPWEQTEEVVYSIAALGEQSATATIDPTSGEITFSALPDESGTTSFTVTANDGQPENNIFSATVRLNVNPVNDPPILSSVEDMELDLNSLIPEIFFTIEDKDQPVSEFRIEATSSNQSLIKDSNITIGRSGSRRMLTIVPETGMPGATTITITVNDGGLIVDNKFTITIDDFVTAIEHPLSEELMLYPNPVSSTLIVYAQRQKNTSITIIISDIKGSEKRRLVTTDENTIIDLTDMNSGVYILRVIDGKKISMPLKVIKR